MFALFPISVNPWTMLFTCSLSAGYGENWYIGEPDQPAMRMGVMEDQLEEMLVQRNHDTLLLRGASQQLQISRIRANHLRNVVSRFPQPQGDSPASATVDEKLQCPTPT